MDDVRHDEALVGIRASGAEVMDYRRFHRLDGVARSVHLVPNNELACRRV